MQFSTEISSALEAGKTLGRPKQNQLQAGKGILKVARELGLGTSSVQRMALEMGPFEPPSVAA
jgi:hypothetical protein